MIRVLQELSTTGRRWLIPLCCILSMMLTGCVGARGPIPAEEIWDPIEPVNRTVFDGNDFLDRNLLEPVVRGYDWLLPEFAQSGVRNFFETLRYPQYLLSDLAQFKFDQVAYHTGRFAINATVGVGGLIDWAEDVGLPVHREDFGSALAYHGVPPGPYLVLPLLGPSTLREGVGRIVDNLVHPLNLLFYFDADIKNSERNAISFGSQALELVQQRTDLIEAIETAKESSVDYYLFSQAAFYQYRLALVNDGEVNEAQSVPEDEEFGTEELDE